MATDNSASPLLSGPTPSDRVPDGAVSYQNSSSYGTISRSALSGRHPSKSPKTPRIRKFVYENRGLLLFALAQFFGNMMGMFTRFLATSLPSGQKYHALHVLFVRMSVTWVFCWAWMWWNRVPEMPLGRKGIRLLLVLRGCTGFVGVFGLYCASIVPPVEVCCKHRG